MGSYYVCVINISIVGTHGRIIRYTYFERILTDRNPVGSDDVIFHDSKI